MKKRILSLVLATLMIISVLPAYALADNAPLPTDASGITATKSAEWVDGGKDGIAEVKIKVKGTAPEETVLTTPTDIVLVIDRSLSMADDKKMDNAKAAATKFAEKLMDGKNVQIAVVSYSQIAYPNNFTKELNTVKKQISDITIDNGYSRDSGTNIQAGIRAARNLLATCGKNDNRIMIVLTDGEPNYSFKNKLVYEWDAVIPYWTWNPTVPVKDADKYNIGKEYPKLYDEDHFKNGEKGTSQNHVEEKTVSEAYFAKKDGYDVYAIGYGLGKQGKRVMKSVASKGMYYDSGISEEEITEVFNKIAQNVKNYCAYDPKVTDIIGTDFDYYEDSTYKPSQSITKSADGRTLTWNVGDHLDETEKTLTFYVKYKNLDSPANPSANDGKLDTNKEAKLTYKTEKEGTAETTLNIDLANSKVPNLAKTISYRVTSTENPKDVGTVPGNAFVWPGKDYKVEDKQTTTEKEKDGVTGSWKFEGWKLNGEEKTTIENVTTDIELTGEWKFTGDAKYGVEYKYVSSDPTNHPLPAAISTPDGTGDYAVSDSEKYYVDATVKRKNPTSSTYTDTTNHGTWTLTWDKDSAIMTASDVTFTGTWTFVEDGKFSVTYRFEGEAPEGAKAPTTSEMFYANATHKVAGMQSSNKTKNDAGETGTWSFNGWTLNGKNVTGELITIAGNTEIVGTWTFTKKDTEPPVGETYDVSLTITKTVENVHGTAPAETYEFVVYYYNTNNEKVYLCNASNPLPISLAAGEESKEKDFTIEMTQTQLNNWPETLVREGTYEGRVRFVYVEEIDGGTDHMTYAKAPVRGQFVGIAISSMRSVTKYFLYSEQNWQGIFEFTNVYDKRSETTGRDVTPAKVLPQLNRDDHVAYIMGYPDGNVRPEGEITRAEACTIFFRLLTKESRDYYFSRTNDYTDVSRTDWFNNAISTLSNAGIVTGYADGTFRPDQPITRGEMAKIIANFARLGGATKSFTDLSGHWAKSYVELAAGNGWIAGYPDGTFGPDKKITRAETVTMINRVLERVPAKESRLLSRSVMLTFPDNKPGEWYYIAVQEASNSHTYQRSAYETAGDEMWLRLIENVDWTKLEK